MEEIDLIELADKIYQKVLKEVREASQTNSISEVLRKIWFRR